MAEPTRDIDLTFLDEGAVHHRRVRRSRARLALAVSGSVTVVWAVYVFGWGHLDRVTERWVAALTMVFGSFVAGSTPQGGGAVAFPVFTKVLDIPAPVARSFALCIQAVGMGAASLSIIAQRRPVVWPAVAVLAPSAVAAFAATVVLAGDRSDPFWAATVPGAYVKVSFTVVIAALAVVVYLGWRLPVRLLTPKLPANNRRVTAGLVAAGLVGGAVSALVGSGTDVFVYLLLVVLLGFDARIGVATSVVCMAIVSVAGLVVLGLVDGQLNIGVDGDRIGSVGGQAVDLPADRFDLFGLWLAAVPVVAWGAPLGAWVASRLQQRHLVVFVMALAVTEVVSTIVTLDELRRSWVLVLYAAVLSLVLIGGMVLLSRKRQEVFALDPLDAQQTLRRADLDVAADYSRRWRKPEL
jgi:uncharacterized membrane protein YfcA